jgi:SAM-dependent methyltransferase
MSESAPGITGAFRTVDTSPDPAMLVAGMDATARWAAVQQLRAWERDRLALKPGERLLDVGCGAGDAAIALAPDVSPGGSVLGIDASDAMLDVARGRAAAAGVDAAFRRGDAMALEEADHSYDAARAERALQWIADVPGAVREMVRIVRPGGRVSLIDTDWRTFIVDLPDVVLVDAVMRAMLTVRGPSMAIGSRLLNLGRDAGLTDLEGMCATHVWTEWDPEAMPAPPGLFPLRPVMGQLVAAGALDEATAEHFLEQVVDAARRDRLYMSLTMVAVAGTVGAS